ncbi:hypothetical protein NVP1135O_59 [Vibrio phage 1.135.O._10N.222.54.B6]|nr:hypothetical protein NVP1135O_59 [Vibrio phage 1.135.O._10N.222.54.B6]
MRWQNVSKVGMPKKNGQYLVRTENGEYSTKSYFAAFSSPPGEGCIKYWCEIDPACCKCGKVDGKDYCYEGDCLPF